jgi:DNA repair protein SbcD/Mre11
MKLLHTADWHLGQKFMIFDREEEHRLTLDWLIEVIKKEKIDLLIIAGDIFDLGNPPNYAQKIYYQFFKKLLTTCCQNCVVIGGNHDSPAMLSAPKDILEILNIKVVGAASDNIEDEIIEIKDDKGKLQAVVAAVPFLRDRDLKNLLLDEGSSEKSERIKEGIYKHYHDAAELCKKYDKIPIIATGHLYAKGAQASDKQDNIYIGNIENISAEQFSKTFDYVALGHIHRAQKVGNEDRIRYSGSIIPLSFSEIQDRKTVTVLDFDGKKIKNTEEIDIPSYRKLVTIKGVLDDVKVKIENLNAKLQLQKEAETKLRAWVEVQIETDVMIPNVNLHLADFTKDMHLDILKIQSYRENRLTKSQDFHVQNLKDVTVLDVFKKRLETVAEHEREGLLASFQEIYASMSESE